MSVNRGADVMFRLPSESSLGVDCTSLSCELSAMATEPGVVTGVVIAGLVAFIAFAYVRDAKACCRRERRRVLDERDAFEEFAERVSGLDPAPVDTTGGGFDGPVIGAHRTGSARSPGDIRLRNVLDAYRDTVMSLPHYTEEYDESVAESLAAELGPDTTTSLATNGTLSPALQSTLVDRGRQAARARTSLADAIDEEIDDLADMEATLTEVDRQRSRLNEHLEGVPNSSRVDASIDVWERLGDLESRCDDMATDRQATIRNPPMDTDATADEAAMTFREYLYGPMDGPRYPVLASVASLADRIREDRSRVARHVSDGY